MTSLTNYFKLNLCKKDKIAFKSIILNLKQTSTSKEARDKSNKTENVV